MRLCDIKHVLLKCSNLCYRFHVCPDFHMLNALFLIEGFDYFPVPLDYPIPKDGLVAYFWEVHLHADALFCGSLASADGRHVFRCGFADHCYNFLMSDGKYFCLEAPFFDHGKAALDWLERQTEPPRYMHDEMTSEEDLEIIYPERNKL